MSLTFTPAERHEHRAARLGPKTLRLVDNRVVAARQHQDLLPPVFDLRKFEQDAALTAELRECLEAIDEIREDVWDTLLARVASETLQEPHFDQSLVTSAASGLRLTDRAASDGRIAGLPQCQ